MKIKALPRTIGMAVVVALVLAGCSNANVAQTSNHTGATVVGASNAGTNAAQAANLAAAVSDGKGLNAVPSYIDPEGHNLAMTSQMVGLTTVYVPTHTDGAGKLVNVGGDASSKTLSITFQHVNMNESPQPLRGGGIVTTGDTVTFTNGVKAQWLTVQSHISESSVLEFQRGSVYITVASTDNTMSKSQVEQVASSMAAIQP